MDWEEYPHKLNRVYFEIKKYKLVHTTLFDVVYHCRVKTFAD